MGRNEYKYLVRRSELDRLRRALVPFAAMDSFAAAEPTQDYTVRSVYFDTPGLACYYQKEAGIHTRRKLRVRGYGMLHGDSLVVLEIKRKSDALGRKSRAFVRYDGLEELLASGDVERFVHPRDLTQRAQAQQNGRAFLFYLHRYSMLPVILVVYEREAFVGRFDPTVRVTFDKGLRARAYPALGELFCEDVLAGVAADHFILEVKFGDRMPSWIAAIVEDFGLERQALSKFGICLEAQGVLSGLSSRAWWAAYVPPRMAASA